MRVLEALLEVVFVPHCAGCDRRVGGGVGLCEVCRISLVELGAACPSCAEPLAGERSVTCRRCRVRSLGLERMVAPYRYGGELAVALRRLKFERRAEIGRALGPLLAPALVEAAAGVDVVMPVPLHWRRLVERGFNQAAVLLRHARAPGDGARVRVDAVSLRRRRATRPQSGLTARRRRDNVAGAFEVVRGRRRRVEGKRVLLVDDVVTTGATMGAAAQALLGAGAAAVIGFCAARAES